MTAVSYIILSILFFGQSSAFLYTWWAKDAVCPSTCTGRFCPFGYLERGCPRCQCSRNPCNRGTCQEGYRCDTKATQCAAVYKCPHESVCVMDRRKSCSDTCPEKQCPHGFKEIGCPRCDCAANPCKANTCNVIFEECLSEAVECMSGLACPHRHNCVLRSRTRLSDSKDCALTCEGKTCSYGFLETGCPRCTCAPNPCETKLCNGGLTCHAIPSPCKYISRCPYEAQCRDTACEDYCSGKRCPYGFSMDGCPRCTCAPNPCQTKRCNKGENCVTEASKCRFLNQCYHIAVCTDNVCSDVCPEKSCPFGFLSKGCPRCDCVPNPCLTVRCPVGQGCTTINGVCQFGSNCPKLPVCKSVCEQTNGHVCRYGYLSKGCPRSTCAPDPCRRFSCPANHVCEARESKCDYSHGCPHKAMCKPPPACEASCRILCKFGMKSEGCPRCHCAPDPCRGFRCIYGTCLATPVKCNFKTNCPYKASCVAPCEASCRISCPYGFVNSGCPRCTCAPNPCQGHRCERGSECITQAVGCPFRTGCPHEGVCRKSRENHRCMQKMVPGNCRRGSTTRYYFDYNRRRCVRFRYSGCGGSTNNFSSSWSCFLTCALRF